MSSRPFDLILFGATGFTGQQAAEYLSRSVPPGLRWAIAGRSRKRLEKVVDGLTGLQPGAVLVADALNESEVDGIARRAQVVLTTAGPFTLYAEHLVEACVRHGTHYLDITGETPWVRTLIDRFHLEAVSKQTRIVPLSGFDSVPADLGTWMVVQELLRRTGETCSKVRSSFRGRGGLNGGTMATALLMSETGRNKALRDPLLLNPESQRSRKLRELNRDILAPVFDTNRNCWLAPFVMAPINGQVVRRSHALFNEAGLGYGALFAYDEGFECHGSLGGLSAAGVATGTGLLMGLMKTQPGRAIIRRLSPNPGAGPSDAAMDNGYVRYRFVAEGSQGSRLMLTLKAKGDPGNRVTVAILCEAGLAMATQLEELPKTFMGGLLTPATAFGGVLTERLRAVGFQFEYEIL